ncbi:MAG TPA: hypothetical protein VGQ86_06545, partial [Candidatus Limnocylindria bacterium]|nr:hypothetical protein [Candidatus Limnocylindria bacterium]
MRLARAGMLAVLLSACVSPGEAVPSRTFTFVQATPSASGSITVTAAPSGTPDLSAVRLVEFPVGRGQGPHDVAPAPDGTVWYTAQRTGELGRLDPKTGATKMTKLGAGSAPHGVIVGPDGAPWVTDGGLN